MHMIAHQAVGINATLTALFDSAKFFKKNYSVFVVLKDVLAINASDHRMVDARVALYASSPWHIISSRQLSYWIIIP